MVGHSQGAWVAWAAVAAGRADPVTHVVLLGVFPSSPVGYPPPGERGVGRIGGDGFRAVEPLILGAGFHFEVDAPLSREVLARPDAAAAILEPPLPDAVRAPAITATPDLPLMPDGWRLHGVRNACPIREAHPYLPLTPAFYSEVSRFLDEEPAAACPAWRPWVGPFAQPFGPPPAGV